MIKKLLFEVFKKAGVQTGNSSKNGRAKRLETIFSEDFKTPISAKSLVGYLEEKHEPRLEIRNAMAKFLGYEDYEDFVINVSETEKEDKHSVNSIPDREIVIGEKGYSRKVILSLGVLLSSIGVYFGFIKEENNCMVWVKDHFEKSACNGQVLEFKINQTELENFRQVSVCDTTKFFEKYDAIVWYDKYNNKMEYFTYYGKNPLNGRTLRPITQTIIDNHVKPCDGIEKP